MPSPTPTTAPTLTPVAPDAPTLTATPNPALACFAIPPTIDGDLDDGIWAVGPTFTFDSPTAPGRPVTVYAAQDDDTVYFAFAISDAEEDPADALRLYLDPNFNLGDPDEADRYFIFERDGEVTGFAGMGNNTDFQLWQPGTTEGVTAAVGEPSANQWVIEAALDSSAVGPLQNPFGLMLAVAYDNNEVVLWPDEAAVDNLATWIPVDNPPCP